MSLRKVWKLLRERRAVSVAISNVILAGAVIVVGFVVLFWGQSQSTAYNNAYSQTMSSDIASLQEKLTFENVFYNSTATNLKVYLLNSGKINNVTIKAVSVINATTGAYVIWSSPVDLRFFNGTIMAKPQHLDMRQEGYFVLSLAGSLKTGSRYSVLITTGRGSSFESTYVA
jgi:archaellum component FlaF (FlaF/FlaG flagellin family)